MKKFIKILIGLVLVFTILPLGLSANNDKQLTILFTHDMHDNLEPFNLDINGTVQSRGGYARLASAINQERKLTPDLLLVDAGDYSMGTLFQTTFATESPTLRLLGAIGYDATTLGNHEFDFRAKGLADSLIAAKASNDLLPTIVASNTVFDDDDADIIALEKAFDVYGVKKYQIIEKQGVKIALIGLMGLEADSNAPMAQVKFQNYIDAAKETVKIISENEEVDLIVALSHTGTDGKPGESEDELLAKNVPEINVIISGHSHTLLEKPIVINDTLIVSAGRYGENLGVLNIVENAGKWNLSDYQIKPIDNSYLPNEEIALMISKFKENIDNDFLSQYDLAYDQTVAYSPFDFTPALDIGDVQKEEPIATLIGDAYIHAIKTVEKDQYKNIDVAIVPNGIIRDSISQGNLTVKDVFNITPLGIGKDGISGYPLIDVYLSGKELMTAAEVDASIQPIMSAAQLYMNGLQYSFNPNRLIFNKVTDIALDTESGNKQIDDDKLYRVVANLYTAQMLNIVGDKSFGLLSIVPKDEMGNVVTNFEDRIIYDGNKELKEWVAVTNYLQSMPKENGVSTIPDKYIAPQNVKVINQDTGLIARLEKPNKIALGIYSIILIILILIITLIRFIVKRFKRNKLR